MEKAIFNISQNLEMSSLPIPISLDKPLDGLHLSLALFWGHCLKNYVDQYPGTLTDHSHHKWPKRYCRGQIVLYLFRKALNDLQQQKKREIEK